MGITLRLGDIRVAHIMHRSAHKDEVYDRVDTFFVADKWEGKTENKEPDKCDDLRWFEVDNLPENVIPYIRQVIRMIFEKSEFYSEFGW